MDATRSFLALDWFVPVHGLKVTPAGKEGATITPPGEDWTSVKCSSKKAYGCGKHGQRLVDGLTLYVSRAEHPDLAASVSIGLNDDSVRAMEAELGVPRSLMNSEGSVQISHQQFLVMVLGFFPHARPKRWYYLVYDSTDASLCMIPFIPRDLHVTYTAQAVPERSADGAGLKLALTARKPILQRTDLRRVDHDRLCVFTPAVQTDPESVTWQTEVHAFMQDRRQRFSADVVFSFQGKFFWADLSQGVKYSDLSTGHSGAVVDTVTIMLPDEYQLESGLRKRFDWPRMSRTMGCVGDSIKFVCIDRCHETLKVLTLDLDHQLWKEDEGLSCSWNDLWKQLISFMDVEMPLNPQPHYPVLLPDGALFFFLPSAPELGCLMDGNHQVCCFDMTSKRPLCFGLVREYPTLGPVVVPSDFFTMCQSSSAPAGEAAKDIDAGASVMCF